MPPPTLRAVGSVGIRRTVISARRWAELAFSDALNELARRGYVVRRVRGYSQIDLARSQIATCALDDGFEETFWIDADVVFKPDDVDRLRAHGLPLACAIYAKKAVRALACHVLPGTREIVFGKGG